MVEGTKRGLFVSFEGIDGCGKSTQARMLADYIFELSKYNHVLKTREPYDNEKIRKMLVAQADPYSHGVELAKMFIEDRKNHVKKLISPTLKSGGYVISDRYSFSTLAYQQTQGVPLKKLVEMHRGLPIPDLVFIVDVPAEVALKRMKKDSVRKTEQKFEKDKEFITQLRKNYIELTKLPNHHIIIVDGTKSIEQIFEKQIKYEFDRLSNERGYK